MEYTFLHFSVTQRHYAIPVSAVREIVPLAATSSLPGQPALLHGFFNLRGDAVPVVSLRTLLDGDTGEIGVYAPLIVLQGQIPLALAADAVLDILTVKEADLTPVAVHSSANDCASAQFRQEDQTIVVLSPARLLLRQERERTSALQALAASRIAALESEST